MNKRIEIECKLSFQINNYRGEDFLEDVLAALSECMNKFDEREFKLIKIDQFQWLDDDKD